MDCVVYPYCPVDVLPPLCVVAVPIVTSGAGEASYSFIQLHGGRRTLLCCAGEVNHVNYVWIPSRTQRVAE